MSNCNTGSCNQPTCGAPQKKSYCEVPFEWGVVPGASCTLFFKMDGFSSTLKLPLCETNTDFRMNPTTCSLEFFNEEYVSSGGTKGYIRSVSAKDIAKCIDLADLHDVDDTPPENCSLLSYHKGASCGVGCTSTGDGWAPYTAPKVTSLDYVAGFNEDGCLVKLDDPTLTAGDLSCRFLVHSGDSSAWQSIPVVADSTDLKDVKMTADGCLVAVEQDVCANTYGPLVVNPVYLQAGNDGLVAISGFTNNFAPTKISPQWFNNTYTNTSECRMKLTIVGRYLNCPEVSGDTAIQAGIQIESSIPSASGKSVIRKYEDNIGNYATPSPATVGSEFTESWILNPGQAVTVQGWGYVRATKGATGGGLSGQDRTSFAPNQIAEANFGYFTMEVF